jgi:alginate O-acetyltransferase complex protein AlgI
MLALIGALFLGMKAVVGIGSRQAGVQALNFMRWTAFACGWPGMRPELFAAEPIPRAGWKSFFLQGSLCVLAGATTMVSAGPLWRATGSTFLVTVLFFFGSSLLVHYGLFTFSASFWRWVGFDCGPLFRNPFLAQSLGEFWGQRWNLAFSEMTALAVYRPMKNRWGPILALFLAFLLSGIFHEAAISLPVLAGFGSPLAYFLLHFGLVAAERAMAKRGIVVKETLGKLWVCFWLVAPLPILFHPPFLKGVIWPLIGVKP